MNKEIKEFIQKLEKRFPSKTVRLAKLYFDGGLWDGQFREMPETCLSPASEYIRLVEPTPEHQKEVDAGQMELVDAEFIEAYRYYMTQETKNGYIVFRRKDKRGA